MRNMQENNEEDDLMSNKYMDNHSDIQSEKNLITQGDNRWNLKSGFNKQQNYTKINLSSNLTSTNNNPNQSNFSINLNANENLQNDNNTNKPLNRKTIKKIQKNNYDGNFAVPSPKKSASMTNTNTNHKNSSFNISLKLIEPVENKNIVNIENQKRCKKKISLIEKNNNNLILPLNEENPFTTKTDMKEDDSDNDNDYQQNLDLSLAEKKLKEEYDSLKEEYNKIKKILEENNIQDKNELV